METNKLAIEEQCLTIEQTKELIKLGIDFSGSNFIFVHMLLGNWGNGINEKQRQYYLSPNFGDYVKIFTKNIPTLSISEMLEMLPNEIACMEDGYLTSYSLMYDGYSLGYVEWCGGEKAHHKINISEGEDFTDGYEICLRKWNLRDALFEMLKWLKQNKLI